MLEPKADIRRFREEVGMIFQSFNLFPMMSVLDNITLAPILTGHMKKPEAEKLGMELLDKVGLADKADVKPVTLSGGQKQRVAIAGVLAMRPKCVVLDEPTAMLDPVGRNEVVSTIHELNEKFGVTVVLITHHMREATEADRVVVMNDGKIIADDTPKKVFSQVELLRDVGLTVPETTDLLYELNERGWNLPLDALSVEECARAIYQEAANA